MKRSLLAAGALSLLLFALTACGVPAAGDPAGGAEKDHYYQILDADGQELYTVTDDDAVAEIDALIGEAGGENAAHGGAEGDPLYTYAYWQETTLHAGEDPEAERAYLEVFRTHVYADGDAVTTEVLSDVTGGGGGVYPGPGPGRPADLHGGGLPGDGGRPAGPGAVRRRMRPIRSKRRTRNGCAAAGCR